MSQDEPSYLYLQNKSHIALIELLLSYSKGCSAQRFHIWNWNVENNIDYCHIDIQLKWKKTSAKPETKQNTETVASCGSLHRLHQRQLT